MKKYNIVQGEHRDVVSTIPLTLVLIFVNWLGHFSSDIWPEPKSCGVLGDSCRIFDAVIRATVFELVTARLKRLRRLNEKRDLYTKI